MKKHLCLIIIIFLQKLFPRKVKTIRVKKLDQNIDSKKIKETKKPKKPLEQKLLYKGDCNNWAIHLEGIVIRKEDRLLLNGEKLLSDGYDCKWDEYRNHPKGLLIRKGNQFLLIENQYLLSGENIIYDYLCMYTKSWGFWYDWYVHPKGIVIRKEDQFLLNGKKLLYEGACDECRSHPKGLLIRKGNQFLLILLNGKKLLCDNKWDDWYVHPEGIVIRKEDQFLLNGKKLLYEGACNECRSHPKGLLIRKGNQFLLILLNGKKLPYKKQQDEKTTEEIMQDLRSRKMKIYLEQEKDKRASQRTRNEKITKEHQKFLQPAEENLQRMIKESKNFKKFIELLFSKEYYHKNYRWEEEGKKKVQIFYNENAIKISIEKNLKILVSKIEIDDDCDGGLDHIKKYLFQLKKEDREEIKKVLEKLSNPEQTIEFLLIESYFEEELIREA